MKLWPVVALLGCAPDSDGTGLVVTADPTGHVEAVDVATGAAMVADPGAFGGIAIAPDHQHVAYVGADLHPRINDLHGDIQTLPTTEGCCAVPVWANARLLTYQLLGGVPLTEMVTLDGLVRRVDSGEIAVSHDGTRLAYLDYLGGGGQIGDLVVEDLDGGDRAVLIAQVATNQIDFDPDDAGLTYAMFDDDNTTHVEHLTFADGARASFGPGTLAPSVPGGSRYSPDGREVLVVDAGFHLVGHALADGAAHPYIADAGVSAAAYLADGKVVASGAARSLPLTPTITITDGTEVHRLGASDQSQCVLSQLSIPHEQIALTCSVPAIVDFSGELVLGHQALVPLGLSADGAGLVTLGTDGIVELVSLRTGARPLATSVLPMSGAINGPVAAYAP